MIETCLAWEAVICATDSLHAQIAALLLRINLIPHFYLAAWQIDTSTHK